MRLDERIGDTVRDRVISLHSLEIKPVLGDTIKINVPPDQLSLLDPEKLPGAKDERQRIGARKAGFTGELFEKITQYFYGGSLVKAPFFISNGSTTNGHPALDAEILDLHEVNDRERGIYGRPDVIDSERRVYLESKACVVGRKVNLEDLQIGVYKALELMRKRDNEYWQTYFVFHRHGVKGVRAKYDRKTSDLLKEFCDNMAYSLVVPLSLIIELHNPEEAEKANNGEFTKILNKDKVEFYKRRKDLVSRFVNTSEKRTRYLPKTYTAFKSRTIDRLFYEPYSVIKDLGLPRTRYRTKRVMSPSGFKINEHSLKQFPILVVTDRNYKRWVDNLYRADVPF